MPVGASADLKISFALQRLSGAMVCESEQGCGSRQGCGRNSCNSESSCSQTEPNLHRTAGQRICIKCKEEASSNEPLCATCLYVSLLSKFKTAVNKDSLVVPSDNVLLAFSGGSASRVALEFLREIRLKAQTNTDASREQGLPVFGLGIVFVSEANVTSISSSESQHEIDKITSIISSKEQRLLPLHTARLQDVFLHKHPSFPSGLDNGDTCVSGNCNEGEGTGGLDQKLAELLKSVEDSTGREDLVKYLRMQVLQQVAKENGYTKLVLGLCTSRIAASAIAATAKGQGFSFPADIQYVDTRWPVPVVLPLRDCLSRELALHCHLANLETFSSTGISSLGYPPRSINELAQSFVSLLQEQNPSREYTITRTMAKLTPFSFNTPLESHAMRRREMTQGRIGNPRINTSMNGESISCLCPICSAPLDVRDFFKAKTKMLGSRAFGNQDGPLEDPGCSDREEKEGIFQGKDNLKSTNEGGVPTLSADVFKSVCCPSCRYQIFPKKSPNAKDIYELLPEVTKERAVGNLTDKRSWMRNYTHSSIKAGVLPPVACTYLREAETTQDLNCKGTYSVTTKIESKHTWEDKFFIYTRKETLFQVTLCDGSPLL